MNEVDWFRSHVERCLQDAWDLPRVAADEDGDYPFRSGTAPCYVAIIGDDVPVFVRVWAQAVVEIKRSAKLLAELNDANRASVTAHAYWSGDSVIVEQTVPAEAVSPECLHQACSAVGTLADGLGVLVASAFGGHTLYDPVAHLEEAAGG